MHDSDRMKHLQAAEADGTLSETELGELRSMVDAIVAEQDAVVERAGTATIAALTAQKEQIERAIRRKERLNRRLARLLDLVNAEHAAIDRELAGASGGRG